jgi:hypothetical protein
MELAVISILFLVAAAIVVAISISSAREVWRGGSPFTVFREQAPSAFFRWLLVFVVVALVVADRMGW